MNTDEDIFLFNRRDLAKLMSTTGPTIDRWSVSPVEKRGNATLYDARTVIQWRLNRDKEQVGVLDLSKEKARLAKEQADSKALDNAKLRGELLPRGVILAQWENDYSVLKSQLLSLPTKLAQSSSQATTPHELEELAREMIYECLGELSRTGLPGDAPADFQPGEEDATPATEADDKPVGRQVQKAKRGGKRRAGAVEDKPG